MNAFSLQVAQWFPIVSRQWASIAHFHEAILEGCRRTLMEDCAGGDRFIAAMAASVLLKGMDAPEAFRELLDLRKEALETQVRSGSHTLFPSLHCDSQKFSPNFCP